MSLQLAIHFSTSNTNYWWDKHPNESQWLYKWRVRMQFSWLYKERKPLQNRGRKIERKYFLCKTILLFKLEYFMNWRSTAYPEEVLIKEIATLWYLVLYFSIYYLLKPYKQIKVDLKSSLSNKLIVLGHITWAFHSSWA